MNSNKLQSKVLRATSNPQEYEIYKAGLEWDLSDPIVIESRKDVKSESRWRDRVEPYNHQVNNLITFCRRLPVTLLADDVGLGKTISAGLIMSELTARSRLNRTLIVAPKLLGPQWAEELQSKFDIHGVVAAGRSLLSAEPDSGAVITTYHSARQYLSQLPTDRFEMLVLDEAHKLRNLWGVEKPPQVAVQFKQALDERRFRFVLMLTATPIQNRLWDLYSLVDLLTVARGHDNPFGSDGQFARKFIADEREKARQLKPEAAAEFRNIVYGYMSRVRRSDAQLHFPERVVKLERADPTPEELRLIEIVAEGIEGLNRLAQISILQALTSSPHALSAQLNNMARNGTVSAGFAGAVRDLVAAMKTSAKLIGLGGLITQLKRENPEKWRLVIFTGRRETQTTIQSFLEENGFEVGIINGSSGPRNQATLASFRANPPEFRIIVSTEAGSEGVNLQVANVLVNYDLPWNPMIVEQRIGRVQRLASEHANVSIFNITLRKTFEDYIVGRLMEKLQMAASAIGDIESLLQGAGVDGEDDATGFEERIRQLVVAALKGADVEGAVRLAEKSIADAKETLQREEQRINELLGGMDGKGYVGPRAPTLPPIQRSLPADQFAVAALQCLGATVKPISPDEYSVDDDGRREVIYLGSSEPKTPNAVTCTPGAPAFARLVQRTIATGVHTVRDLDEDIDADSNQVAETWVSSFDGTFKGAKFDGARRWFSGKVLVRTRATVAHDSYERLVEIPCSPKSELSRPFDRASRTPLPNTIENLPAALGVPEQNIIEMAERDPAIAEFSRFYLERRQQEVEAAGSDKRKRKKMEEDFTPRLSLTAVGAEGGVAREIRMKVKYDVDGSSEYESQISVLARSRKVLTAPSLAQCGMTGRNVPSDCLGKCAISGVSGLKHLLVSSQQSGRFALPDYVATCEQTGKRLLSDEVETSSLSGRKVSKALLKTSAVSGLKAEQEHFGRCAITGADVLTTELLTSDVSGKLFRSDQQERCAISGTIGHKSEFVQSSVGGSMMVEREAVRSDAGKFCMPKEARSCEWSGRLIHPDDLKICELTGLRIHSQFTTDQAPTRLEPLQRLLDGVDRHRDCENNWESLSAAASALASRGKWRIEAAVTSPDARRLAAVAEVRTFLGFKSRHAGVLFELADQRVIGRMAMGKRAGSGWHMEG